MLQAPILPLNGPPPKASFVKMNFDGASKGNLGLVGFGGVFKNHLGQILRIYSVGKESTNNEVELGTMNQGLSISIREGIQKLIVEGDSLVVIHSLRKLIHGSTISKISSSWRLEAGIECLKQLLSSIEVIIPSHVRHVFVSGSIINVFPQNSMCIDMRK
jgi:ribonuclease HI